MSITISREARVDQKVDEVMVTDDDGLLVIEKTSNYEYPRDLYRNVFNLISVDDSEFEDLSDKTASATWLFNCLFDKPLENNNKCQKYIRENITEIIEAAKKIDTVVYPIYADFHGNTKLSLTPSKTKDADNHLFAVMYADYYDFDAYFNYKDRYRMSDMWNKAQQQAEKELHDLQMYLNERSFFILYYENNQWYCNKQGKYIIADSVIPDVLGPFDDKEACHKYIEDHFTLANDFDTQSHMLSHMLVCR